ncbi:MAG: hypothetical protein H6935_10155 [Thiobacillus sp.]|nr:hypothetical protein [Thiobacillus sp.]
MALGAPEQEPLDGEDRDTLERFRNWHGFLAAALAVNALFVYGMLGNVADPSVSAWFKALVWLPFNAIATAVYLMLALRLSKGRGGMFFVTLCAIVGIGNWVVMLLAGN